MDRILATKINDKLVKFAGFEYHYFAPVFGNKPTPESGYYIGEEFIRRTCPDFINDSQLQQKYLWPKLLEIAAKLKVTFDGVEFGYDDKLQKWFCFIGFLDNYGWTTLIDGEPDYDENPARCFALTMDRLINFLEQTNE